MQTTPLFTIEKAEVSRLSCFCLSHLFQHLSQDKANRTVWSGGGRVLPGAQYNVVVCSSVESA